MKSLIFKITIISDSSYKESISNQKIIAGMNYNSRHWNGIDDESVGKFFGKIDVNMGIFPLSWLHHRMIAMWFNSIQFNRTFVPAGMSWCVQSMRPYLGCWSIFIECYSRSLSTCSSRSSLSLKVFCRQNSFNQHKNWFISYNMLDRMMKQQTILLLSDIWIRSFFF